MLFPILASILMLPGIIGIVLPVFPGVAYIWFVSLIFGLSTGFANLTLAEFGGLSILFGISIVIDYLSGILGAKFGGASLKSLGAGAVGLLLGILLFPPLGGIIGMFLGIFITEIGTYQDHTKAIRAASGGVIGSLVGMFINLGLGLWFITAFLLQSTS
jgi:uncharacterized protein YqgC (DUF456 family)